MTRQHRTILLAALALGSCGDEPADSRARTGAGGSAATATDPAEVESLTAEIEALERRLTEGAADEAAIRRDLLEKQKRLNDLLRAEVDAMKSDD